MVAAQRKLPAHLPSIPLELLAVCGLMALSGILLLWPGLSLLSDGFPVLGDGSFGLALGLLVIDIGALILALAAALLLLAWRLSLGDRVARGLSYVLLGAIVFSSLVGGTQPVGLIIVMLFSIAALIILAAAPNVRQFFTGAAAPDGGQPVSVVIARTLLTWFAVAAIFLGVTFLPMGVLGGKMVLAGVIFLGVGAGVIAVSSRLARGEPMARLIVTGLMALYALLALIGGGRNTGTLLELCIAAGIACLLWLPQDAKAFFAQAPAQAQQPQFGAAGFGAPGYDGGYGAPGNGAPANGAPGNRGGGYGAPGNGAPANGAPGNRGGGYGAPGNGAPGGGAGYGAPGGSGAGYGAGAGYGGGAGYGAGAGGYEGQGGGGYGGQPFGGAGGQGY
jgi:hypothetical protein